MRAGVNRVVREAAAVLVDALTRPKGPAGALPGDNRLTEVELTMVGAESGVTVAPAVLAEQLVAYLRAHGVRKQPTVLVLETNVVGEYTLVLQFRVELDWPADRAQYECELQCSRLVDGESVLGYGVQVVGVK